jgi:hypothetical protein
VHFFFSLLHLYYQGSWTSNKKVDGSPYWLYYTLVGTSQSCMNGIGAYSPLSYHDGWVLETRQNGVG